MNVAEMLRRQAGQRPGAIALIESKRRRSRSVTFAELEQASGRVATLLDRHGLQPGDAVLVFHPMSAELYSALAAILRLGLVAMFLDPSGGQEHIRQCCRLRAPRAVIASAKVHLLRLLSPELQRIPLKFTTDLPVPGAISMRRADRLPYFETIQPCTPDCPALLTFTSGSTGEAKAALRSHGFLLAQHQALAHTLELQAGQVDLTTQPILLLANMASGVTSVIPDADLRRPDAIDPAPVVAQIRKHNPSRSAASPAFYERLIEYCRRRDITLTGFEQIFTGGGPVTPDLIEKIRHMAPNATVTAIYGCTEAEPIACIAHSDIADQDAAAALAGRGLLAGRPVPILQLRILKDQWGRKVGPYAPGEFDAACEPVGKPGEIVISGDHVLAGYISSRDQRQYKFDVADVRWHRTGDAGYLDDAGRLWLLGRCSARIHDKRGTLYPFSAEHAALQHDFVHRAALVAQGERRVLAIEPRHGPIGDAQIAKLVESLTFAHIHDVRVVDRLPVDKRHNAKIDYPQLMTLLEKSA